MLSRVLRRLVPAALLTLPVLGGLWATSGPATLAAPYPFQTPACSTAQTGLGTGTASAIGSGTVFFGPETGFGAILLGGVEHDFEQGSMSWNFTTQLRNDASGGGNMTSSLRAVVSGVPGIGAVTFTPSCLLFAAAVQQNPGGPPLAELIFQGTATGFGPVSAVFVSGRGPTVYGLQTVAELELLPPGNVCQNLYAAFFLAEAFGGQFSAALSGGFEGEPFLARFVSTVAPCLGSASPQAGSQSPFGNLPLPLPIALP